jgi:septum site-determining protein MinC
MVAAPKLAVAPRVHRCAGKGVVLAEMSGTEAIPAPVASAIVLRGTGRGLEVDVAEAAPLYEVLGELEARLSQSPAFFEGADATIDLGERTLPPGGLAHLKAIVDRYGVRIVELRSARAEVREAAGNLQIPVGAKAGAAPASAPRSAGAEPAPGEVAEGARLCVGPVRSGVVLEAPGHLVVVGDVNPGAEVRAGKSIVVMGALRGVAHAVCGGAADASGCIVALRLSAQQLRIGPLIARAADASAETHTAEIAYAQDGRIIVEPYQGRLPGALSGLSQEPNRTPPGTRPRPSQG